MRLIDADKLIEDIEENNQKLEERIKDARTYIQKEVYEAQLFTAVDIVKLIKEQPTVFDIDKVEKELEEKVENSNLNIQIICFSQALDIFKGGKNE